MLPPLNADSVQFMTILLIVDDILNGTPGGSGT